MVEATVQLLIYWPLAAAGFALTMAPIRASMFSLQLLGAEGDLADGAVDDVGLVQTVLDLTGFDFLDGLGDVGGDGAGLGGGHQTLGAQDLTETADNAHHVGSGDDHVKVEPVLLL